MSQVILLLMFPMGIYVYFIVDKKNHKEYEKVFKDFEQSINFNKKELFNKMLLKNGYAVVKINEHEIIGEKKILSLGLMMIGFGMYGIGLFIYLLYFYLFQSPHRVRFSL